MTALVAVASLSVTGYACLLAVHRQHVRAADSRRVVSGISALVSSRALVALSSAGKASSSVDPSGTGPGGATTSPLTLTASERQDCPAGAAACVDLTDKITWLQAGGKVTYGPVSIEPSPTGARSAGPTGTFHVTGKAGSRYVSTVGHDLMPWAVLFAPSRIAFCAGSLTQSSDDCVHLALATARYYNQRLPVGAEVVVFLG